MFIGRKDPTPPLPGRITGSSSIDTLVRVGLEKEDLQNGGSARPQMVVLHDFVPCVEDELAVKRGQRVTILYQENDWVYVLASDGREGFVPFVYCVPLGRSIDDLHVSTKNARPLNNSVSSVYEKTSDVFREYRDFGDHGSHMNNDAQTASSLNRNISRSMPSITTANSSSHEETDLHNSSDTPLLEDRQAKVAKVDPNRHGYSNFSFSKGPVSPLTADESSGSLLNSSSEVGTFRKAANGRFIMLFTFMAMEEGDLSVERGEFVTVLNKDDPDWFWVARSDHSEGFIPSNFLCPANGHKSTFQREYLCTFCNVRSHNLNLILGILTLLIVSVSSNTHNHFSRQNHYFKTIFNAQNHYFKTIFNALIYSLKESYMARGPILNIFLNLRHWY